MPTPQLSKIDLNLLVVLDVLLREKSVGRAADQLHLTSSAISHALKRLRTLFDNELLVREGRHMVPTSMGQSLADALPPLLSQMEQILAAPAPFDPSTSKRGFRLVAPDFFSSLLPNLFLDISNQAPGIRVDMVAFSESAIWDMGRGRYDALIAPRFRQTDELRGTPIGSWPWTVFGRKGHPAFQDWSIKSWARYPHLQVGLPAPTSHGPIDRVIAELGVTRKVAAAVPHFSMAAPILAQTDLLLSVSSVAMKNASRAYQLETRPLPFEVPRIELMLFLSAVTADQPEIRWFHDCVHAAATTLLEVQDA